MIGSLDDLPAVAAYLRRIGAIAINFKSATMTKEIVGYPKVVGWVNFSDDGMVFVSGDASQPNSEEAAAITEAFKNADFPKMVTLTAIAEPPPGVDLNSHKVFICHDFRDQIVMVHERYETKDGHKGFLPWTFWSDGQWRKMEPPVMPFFGLPGARDCSTLYIHEGSKAAARVKRVISGQQEDKRFPWLEQMRWGHHIGWIGGIHALDRSDWESLAKMGWKKVIIVADNDHGGVAIVPDISEHFKCMTMSLIFTDEWPLSFDLGDDWPDNLFGPEGQYIGQPYERCLQPATFATDEIVIPADTPRGRDRIEHVIRPWFAEQWAWVESVDQVVNIELPNYRMKSSNFNGFIRPFSGTPQTLQKFQKRFTGNQMNLTYDPSNEGTMVRDNSGLQSINLYQPPSVKPIQGDWSPWLVFMEYLIPDRGERDSVMRWIATLRARPAIRMLFGILLMSERQGVGKGTLGRILADLVGRHNTSFPGEQMIVNSEFNGWIEGRRLIVVDEIYSGHSWKAYNKLKPYVSDETIEVNVKHQATWSMPNWTHYLLMSNSRAALKLEATDRRWLVPEVTEKVWTTDQFEEFNAWMRQGGIAHIAYWAHTYEQRGEGTYVRAGETAPMSDNKARLIDESRSETEVLLMHLSDALKEREDPIAIPLSSLKGWCAERLNDRVYESPQAMGRILRNNGVFLTDRTKLGGIKQVFVVNKEAMTIWGAGQIKEALRSPESIIDHEM